MFNNKPPEDAVFLSRYDVNNPLSSYSKHEFELDGETWPSVEHYYQAMKFEIKDRQDCVRLAPHPKDAEKIAKKYKRDIRKDWSRVKLTLMTRAVYTKCLTHGDVKKALFATDDKTIVETSQYDYFWGRGRDGRGENHYGQILCQVRDKIRADETS